MQNAGLREQTVGLQMLDTKQMEDLKINIEMTKGIYPKLVGK